MCPCPQPANPLPRSPVDPLRLRGVIALLVLAISLVAVPAASAAGSGTGPLVWTAPREVDLQPIDGLSCPSIALCVGVDRAGGVLWSTAPASSRRWNTASIDGHTEITGVSCPAVSLCVAVDAAGNVLTTQNVAAGAAGWAVARVDTSATQNNTDNAGSVLLRGVSCPSTGLCVAVDAAGNALVSTNPTAGPSAAWTITHIDANTTVGCTGAGLSCQPPLVGISCASTTLCAAVDFAGNLLTTSQPAVAVPWATSPTNGGGLSSLYGISCPVISFCVTVDGIAGGAISLNPAAPAIQQVRSLPDSLYGIWCQSPTLCLASIETQDGISGLLGSFNPAAPTSTWTPSSLGGVNAVACPLPSVCVAADDEGGIAAGATTTSISGELGLAFLAGSRQPKVAALNRTAHATFVFASPIAAAVKLVWTVPGQKTTAGQKPTPLIVASASHVFGAPGTARLTLWLTPTGKRLFTTARGRFTVTATATFAASTGSVNSVKKLTFRGPPPPKPGSRRIGGPAADTRGRS
jgi:hypothetical protein